MEQCFGKHGAEAIEASGEYLAQPFYAFAVFRRILRGREHPDGWVIEEVNSHDVVQLRESGRSFIVATAHFRRDSQIVLYLPRICPGHVAAVAVPLVERALRPYNIRERVHFGQILKTILHTRPDTRLLYAGEPSVLEILEYLQQPNSQVLVAVDAFLKKTGRSAVTRPFAGMRARSFSIGTSTFSRVAQCPIVACATHLKEDGTVVLEWGPVIPPPNRLDDAADLRTANALLDFLETAIGRRPDQYVLSMGDERRWNQDLEIWDSPKEAEL